MLVVVSSPSLAQPPRRADTRAARQEIQDAERARAAELKAQREATARAEKAVATERRLVGDRAAALSRLRATEQTTAAIAARVEALVAQESTAEQNILARAEDLAVLMPLLHRLSRYPAETMLAVQPNQDRALRGVLVLRGLATQMERDAKALRAEQAGLARTQENLGTEQLRLGAALAAQAAAGAVLDRQIGAVQGTRRAQEGLAEDAARKAAQQAERASSLRAVITEIEAQRRASEEQARAEADRATRERRTGAAAAARRREAALARPSGAGTIAANAPPHGQLLAPVGGVPARVFGAATEAGPATGLTYHPAPGARIVSPCAGRVVFAAPFRSFGLLLIVDCGALYHGVLAGMERLDVEPGRTVEAGEKLGVMGDWDARSGTARPMLYLELRRDGRPVDPTPWLARFGMGAPG
ncbi:MAG: hypothetical protein EXR09_04680 [Acetobacteraceae bacterium]|nr:hypothetical protein [Acetobacteraceae bacterium]